MRKSGLLLGILLTSLFLSGCNPLEWRRKAGLQVLSNDMPATILIDDKELGKTPYIDKELAAGEYNVQIKPQDPSLASYEAKVSLKKGLLTVINWSPGTRPETSGGVIYEMEKIRGQSNSELSLTTIPDGAIIQVDGQAKGFAPVLVEDLSPGQHEYEVKLPSYEPQQHTINAQAGYRMLVTIKLAKQDYQVQASPTPEIANPTLATAAASPGPSLSPSPSPTASPSPSASPRVSPSASPSAQVAIARPKVRINNTGFSQGGQEVLRIRATPTSSGEELGVAPIASEYAYLNESTLGWHKIQFGTEVGWVSGKYSTLLE